MISFKITLKTNLTNIEGSKKECKKLTEQKVKWAREKSKRKNGKKYEKKMIAQKALMIKYLVHH